MAHRAAVALAALGLEINHLLALLGGSDDCERDLGALHVGRANLERRAVRDGADGVESDFVALVDRELFNLDRVADLHKRLLAAGFEYSVCFHDFSLLYRLFHEKHLPLEKSAE